MSEGADKSQETKDEKKRKEGDYVVAGNKYLNSAQEALAEKNYRKVGDLFFKSVAAHMTATCLRRGVYFGGKDHYFSTIEELTSQESVDWVERAMAVVVILHNNDESGFLTNGQVRRFSSEARRLVRWIRGL